MITINVNPIDDPSSIDPTSKTSWIINEDDIIEGSLKANDPEGLTNNQIYKIGSNQQANHGNVIINPTSGEWTYTPEADFHGTDNFTISITDDNQGVTKQQIDIKIDPVDDYQSLLVPQFWHRSQKIQQHQRVRQLAIYLRGSLVMSMKTIWLASQYMAL